MYQAIVIDDEKWVVKSLIATIKNQDYFEITTEFYDGLSGLEIYPYSSTGPCICGCKTSWHGWTRNSAGSSCGRLINSFHYDKRTC